MSFWWSAYGLGDGGLTSIGASDFIQALVTEGIIAGVGAVLVFVPQIFALFFSFHY